VLRVATFNIWNSKRNWSRRLAGAVEELSHLDADVVALQEAPVQAAPGLPLDRFLRDQTAYPHVLHLPYPGPADKREWPEGLAFLSKLPIDGVRVNWEDGQPTENSWAGRIVIRWGGGSLGITNVHLDWRHAASDTSSGSCAT
jgi:maltose 6'-phosphate phosphatase